MRRFAVLAFALGLVTSFACEEEDEDDCPAGTEGCPCDAGECDDGLRCNFDQLMLPEEQNMEICIIDDNGG